MTLKIIIADDHRIVREGLRNLLENHSRIKVIASVDDGLAVLEKAAQERPDIAILDITMPGLNGLETTRRLLEMHPKSKVIILSMHSDRQFVMEAMRAGASGYVLKDSAFQELLIAIRNVQENQVYLSGKIARLVIDDYLSRKHETDSSAFSVLSSREREVLQMLSEGIRTKDIAGRLHVSVKTIESHRKQIMDKLGIRSIAELTKYAIRQGLTSLE